MVLAMRLALQGLASGLAADDLIAYGSRTGQVELELCDGPNILQIKRQISSSGENVRVNLRQGLAQASADNPAAGQALIGRMFAYPVDQVCEFFMWSSASGQSCDCLAAERTYLRRVLDRLDGDAEIEPGNRESPLSGSAGARFAPASRVGNQAIAIAPAIGIAISGRLGAAVTCRA